MTPLDICRFRSWSLWKGKPTDINQPSSHISSTCRPRPVSFRMSKCLAEMRGSWNVLGSRSNYADGQIAGAHNNIQPGRGDWGENFPPLHSSKWIYLFSDGHVECLVPYETVGKEAELPGKPYGMWAHQPCPNCFKLKYWEAQSRPTEALNCIW